MLTGRQSSRDGQPESGDWQAWSQPPVVKGCNAMSTRAILIPGELLSTAFWPSTVLAVQRTGNDVAPLMALKARYLATLPESKVLVKSSKSVLELVGGHELFRNIQGDCLDSPADILLGCCFLQIGLGMWNVLHGHVVLYNPGSPGFEHPWLFNCSSRWTLCVRD